MSLALPPPLPTPSHAGPAHVAAAGSDPGPPWAGWAWVLAGTGTEKPETLENARIPASSPSQPRSEAGLPARGRRSAPPRTAPASAPAHLPPNAHRPSLTPTEPRAPTVSKASGPGNNTAWGGPGGCSLPLGLCPLVLQRAARGGRGSGRCSGGVSSLNAEAQRGWGPRTPRHSAGLIASIESWEIEAWERDQAVSRPRVNSASLSTH